MTSVSPASRQRLGLGAQRRADLALRVRLGEEPAIGEEALIAVPVRGTNHAERPHHLAGPLGDQREAIRNVVALREIDGARDAPHLLHRLFRVHRAAQRAGARRDLAQEGMDRGGVLVGLGEPDHEPAIDEGVRRRRRLSRCGWLRPSAGR
jgi:hypothetical protein